VIDAVLEGGQGVAEVDATDRPRAARLDLGVYRILGGEAGPAPSGRLLDGLAPPCEIVVGDGEEWLARVREVFGARAVRREMDAFLPDGLDPARLRGLAETVPDGFEVVRIAADLAARIGPELAPNGIDIFGGPRPFAERGLGFAAVAGDRVACAATSYAVSRRSCEIAIATDPGFRRRGLAAAAGARMALECLERGLAPHWNAANPASSRLAARIGFTPAGVCAVHDLKA
jgi:GNAT superfamily N-acetyltransferase